MTINVLAVDDSRTMRDMITLALKDEGFDVTTADDGLHGLEVLEGLQPDVIITDINMPRMDGFGTPAQQAGSSSPSPRTS